MSDLQRLHVVQALEAGRVTVQEAAELLGRSVRQVRRIVKRYREEQEAGIPHRSRGRRPANALPPEVREQVAELARERYAGCNHHHLRDLLAEGEGIELGVSTVRRLRLAAGLGSPRSASAHRLARSSSRCVGSMAVAPWWARSGGARFRTGGRSTCRPRASSAALQDAVAPSAKCRPVFSLA